MDKFINAASEITRMNKSDAIKTNNLISTKDSYYGQSISEKMLNVIKQVHFRIFHKDQQYKADEASNHCMQISKNVKKKLKEFSIPNYRFFVEVTVGEKRNQGAHVRCKCLWNEDKDKFVTETFTNEYLFCVTSVYGVCYKD